jgi:lipoprotein-anchoring transpeptidase ErfK/SrfK
MITRIEIHVSEQTLTGFSRNDEVLFATEIATAKNGIGQREGSECTPLGSHRIRAKIGTDLISGTVFIGRRPSGEVYDQSLGEQYPGRDWILTRILWLCGNDTGLNRGGQVDTQRRYIYLHGAPDSHSMGTPSSHGCIKMRNRDIIALFDLVSVGTVVNISK